MSTTQRAMSLSVIAAVFATGACSRSRVAGTPQPGVALEDPPRGGGPTTIGDPQVVAILTAANNGEIQEALLAQTHAANPSVRAFADHMQSAHTASLEQLTQLSVRAHIAAMDNPASTQIATDARHVLTSLENRAGPEFDRVYMDAQVTAHTDLLRTIDTVLIPNTHNSELLHLIDSQVRPMVSGHLANARRLVETLNR